MTLCSITDNSNVLWIVHETNWHMCQDFSLGYSHICGFVFHIGKEILKIPKDRHIQFFAHGKHFTYIWNLHENIMYCEHVLLLIIAISFCMRYATDCHTSWSCSFCTYFCLCPLHQRKRNT